LETFFPAKHYHRPKHNTSSTNMSAQHPNVPLDEDTIDDLLYSARTGDKDALEADLTSLASKNNTTLSHLLSKAIDETTGNSVLHYACANGHQG